MVLFSSLYDKDPSIHSHSFTHVHGRATHAYIEHKRAFACSKMSLNAHRLQLMLRKQITQIPDKWDWNTCASASFRMFRCSRAVCGSIWSEYRHMMTKRLTLFFGCMFAVWIASTISSPWRTNEIKSERVREKKREWERQITSEREKARVREWKKCKRERKR